jgi:hypothetical protein
VVRRLKTEYRKNTAFSVRVRHHVHLILMLDSTRHLPARSTIQASQQLAVHFVAQVRKCLTSVGTALGPTLAHRQASDLPEHHRDRRIRTSASMRLLLGLDFTQGSNLLEHHLVRPKRRKSISTHRLLGLDFTQGSNLPEHHLVRPSLNRHRIRVKSLRCLTMGSFRKLIVQKHSLTLSRTHV